MDTDDKIAIGVFASIALIAITTIAAWTTSVIICIKTASWLLLAAVVLVFPIGVAHGIGVWLGVL